MTRRPFLTLLPLWLALLALASLATGCGPHWVIVAQAVPDPLLGAKAFYVEPVHFDPPIVGDKREGEYLADKTQDQRDRWQADKAEASHKFAVTLMGLSPNLQFPVQPAPGVFIVRPIVPFMEPGIYTPFFSRPTELQMRLQILTSDGVLVDEIVTRSLIGASLIYPTSGGRIRMAGDDLGKIASEYIAKRVAGQ
jgi:hypothetical protein